MSSDYFVKLDRFEGPLDLLLHLIRVHEIDIFSIDIFRLTTEYLNYLRLVDFEDLNDAGEFVAMAAALIEMKSRMLLPVELSKPDPSEDGLEDLDPVKQLQERLLQYEMIRRAAEHLSQLPQLGVEIQTNHEAERLAPLFAHIESPIEGDPATLVILYEQLLQALSERKYARVEAKTHLITLEQTIEKLSGYVDTVKFCMFQSFYNKFASRYDFVVYFMAVLELAKSGKIKTFQQDLLGPLWIYRGDCEASQFPIANIATPVHDAHKGGIPIIEVGG